MSLGEQVTFLENSERTLRRNLSLSRVDLKKAQDDLRGFALEINARVRRIDELEKDLDSLQIDLESEHACNETLRRRIAQLETQTAGARASFS